MQCCKPLLWWKCLAGKRIDVHLMQMQKGAIGGPMLGDRAQAPQSLVQPAQTKHLFDCFRLSMLNVHGKIKIMIADKLVADVTIPFRSETWPQSHVHC